LLDCEALNWDVDQLMSELDAGRWTYEEFVYHMAAAPGSRAGIPSRWNDLERYEPGQTALTHYTDMDQQPWLETINPNARIWCQGLFDAIADGAVSLDAVKEEAARGHVRPSLVAQIELGIADPLLLPRNVKRLDSRFAPPHVLAASGVKGRSPRDLRLLLLARRARMFAWRTSVRLGVWEAAKRIRSALKTARQNQRVASARRRAGLT
jgi:hypothetical protein